MFPRIVLRVFEKSIQVNHDQSTKLKCCIPTNNGGLKIEPHEIALPNDIYDYVLCSFRSLQYVSKIYSRGTVC